MRYADHRRTARTLAVLIGLTLVLGCGGSDGDGEVECADPFSTNLTGDWNVTETYASGNPDCAGSDDYAITLTQDGGNLVWQKAGVGSLLMRLCGDIIQVPAEARPMDQGLVLRINSFAARFDSETRFSGIADFAIVIGANGAVVCSGQVGVEGLRQ